MQALLTDVQRRDPCTTFEQVENQLTSDAVASTGDDDNLVSDFHLHFLSMSAFTR